MTYGADYSAGDRWTRLGEEDGPRYPFSPRVQPSDFDATSLNNDAQKLVQQNCSWVL